MPLLHSQFTKIAEIEPAASHAIKFGGFMPILFAGGENLMRLLGELPANGRGLREGT
jgi:hypothetical protein